jgi:hypothetical protein
MCILKVLIGCFLFLELLIRVGQLKRKVMLKVLLGYRFLWLLLNYAIR